MAFIYRVAAAVSLRVHSFINVSAPASTFVDCLTTRSTTFVEPFDVKLRHVFDNTMDLVTPFSVEGGAATLAPRSYHQTGHRHFARTRQANAAPLVEEERVYMAIPAVQIITIGASTWMASVLMVRWGVIGAKTHAGLPARGKITVCHPALYAARQGLYRLTPFHVCWFLSLFFCCCKS